jgi:hypothetical protein
VKTGKATRPPRPTPGEVCARGRCLRAKVRHAITIVKSGQIAILRHPGLPELAVVPHWVLQVLERSETGGAKARRPKPKLRPLPFSEDNVVRLLEGMIENRTTDPQGDPAGSPPGTKSGAQRRPSPKHTAAATRRRRPNA